MTVRIEAGASVGVFAVENPDSSSPAFTTFCSAILIRSAAILRRALPAHRLLDDLPGLGMAVRHVGLLVDQAAMVPGGPLRPVHRQRALRQLRRPPDEVHHRVRDVLGARPPVRRYDFSISNSAGRCSSQFVAPVAHSSSSRLGEKRSSSCAVIAARTAASRDAVDFIAW
ncbi:hypothetical protein ACVWXU_005103 [Streptomyces sp. TE33382]